MGATLNRMGKRSTVVPFAYYNESDPLTVGAMTPPVRLPYEEV